jgi:hypothetical protein
LALQARWKRKLGFGLADSESGVLVVYIIMVPDLAEG